jgi:hypothetical protein
MIYDLDLNKMKCCFCSNLNRPSKIQQLNVFLLPRLGPVEQRHRSAMAAGLRGLNLELQCTICDEVSSYVIYTTRGTHFTHLRRQKWATGSDRR